MLVLAALPREFAARLRRAAGRRFTTVTAGSWELAVQTIRQQPVELAVVDPALDGDPRAQEIERLGVLFPSLPRIVYTRLSAALVPVLLRLGRAGIEEVVLADHDDHPQRLGDALALEAARAVSRRLIGEMSDVLAEWPGELRWAVETVLKDPGALRSVQALAERARMDRRTCVRWFTRANLPPPRALLTACRALYAHRLLLDPGYTVEDVATRLGYSRVKSFVEQMKEVFGMTPGEARVSLTPDEAIAIVQERCLRAHVEALASVS